MTQNPNTKKLVSTIKQLTGLVSKNGEIYEVQIKTKKDSKNAFTLAYYRNNLVQVFLNEAYIATAITSLKGIAQSELSVLKIWEKT